MIMHNKTRTFLNQNMQEYFPGKIVLTNYSWIMTCDLVLFFD